MKSSNTLRREDPLRLLIDPYRPTANSARKDYRMAVDLRWWLVPLAIGVALILLSLLALLDEALRPRFFYSYLVGYSFCLTIALGALFFVMIQHVTRAEWSLVVRRISETLMWSFPMLAVLLIPILLGMHDLYHWTHPELFDVDSDHYDALVADKEPYLNTPFFLIRMVIYFGAWIYISHRLYALSVQYDINPDPDYMVQRRRVSAWGIIVFALTLSFASFDLLMSLDPHWFSTIFPVYIFAGSTLSAFATITLIAMMYRRADIMKHAITREHYHDLGKFIFGFVVFWAYIAFSQYMLIWYANIPEETLWYRHRMEGGWGPVSQLLAWGHFVIPFLILISRTAKRNLPVLAGMCVWLLIFHYIDLYWIAMPNLSHYFSPHPLDVALWLGLTSLFISAYIYRAHRHSLAPYREPGFNRSLAFENV